MKKTILFLLVCVTVFAVNAQVVENFEIPPFTSGGNLEGTNGWTLIANTNPVGSDIGGASPVINSGALTYAGYASSGIGNTVVLPSSINTRTSQKSTGLSAPADGSSVYVAFLVKVSSAGQSTNRELVSINIGTAEFARGRIFANYTSDGVFFGIAKNSPAVMMTGTRLSAADTHLLIMKYNRIAGTNNDVVTLYINPDLSLSEAAQTNKIISTAESTQSDLGTGSLYINLRQRNLGAQVGGMRIGTTWVQAVGINVENFEIPPFTSGGNLEGTNGWSLIATAADQGGNSPVINSGALTYAGYASSGVGNKAELNSTNDTRTSLKSTGFTAPADGTAVYVAFLAKVSGAGRPDFERALVGFNIGTAEWSRGSIYVRYSSHNEGVKFGVAKVNTKIMGNYIKPAEGTVDTHLLVMKYSRIAGTNNDVVTLYINPDLSLSEAAQTNKLTADSESGATDLGTGDLYINLRQRSLGAQVGGMRIVTSWSQLVGELITPLDPPTVGEASSVGAESFTANWTAVANATGYDVKVYQASTLVGTYPASGQATNSLLIKDLLTNTAYTYKVIAKGDGTSHSNSAESSASATFTTLEGLTTIKTAFNDGSWSPVLSTVPASGSFPSSSQNGYDLVKTSIYNSGTRDSRGEFKQNCLRLDVSANGGMVILPTVKSLEQIEIHINPFSAPRDFGLSELIGGTWTSIGTYTMTSTAYNEFIIPLHRTTPTKLRIENKGGGGVAIYQITTRTTNPALLTTPTVGAASAIAATSFTANWTAVANATGYSVQVYQGSTKVKTTNVSGQATTSLYITGLNPTTSYTYKVLALGDDDVNYSNSFLSVAASFTTISTNEVPAGGTAFVQDTNNNYSKIGKGNLTKSPISGQPFPNVFTYATSTDINSPWDAKIVFVPNNALSVDDVLLVSFYARTTATSLLPGEGYLNVCIEEKGTYEKVLYQTVSVDAEWKQYFVPVKSLVALTAANLTCSFHVGFPSQTIEMGGIQFINYSNAFNIQDLPMTGITYIGREADASWRTAANDRINQIRKGNVKFKVLDNNGLPIQDANVSISMKQHKFGFGSAITASNYLNNATYKAKVHELFNEVVFENDMKWDFFNSKTATEKQQLIQAMDELDGYNIKVRGHNVIWPSWKYSPSYLESLSSSNLSSEINNRIDEITTFTKNKVNDWDVINEPYSEHDFMDKIGNSNSTMVGWLQRVRTNDANVKLYLNDYSILTSLGINYAKQNAYIQTVEDLNGLGGGVQGVGFQGHFGSDLTPIVRLKTILDNFSALNVDIKVTEFDIDLDQTDVQADYTRDFLTMMFSHPSVKSVLMWSFWEGSHWRPNAAIYKNDWTIKPNGQAYKDLILDAWWTDNINASTNAQGELTFNGFLGTYNYTVNHNGKDYEGTFDVSIPVADATLNEINISLDGNPNSTLSIDASTAISSLGTLNTTEVTVSGTNTQLTVDESKTIAKLTMEAGTKLTLSATGLQATDVVLKASKTDAPSVTVSNGMTINGNLSLHKTIDNSRWYFISFPSNVAISAITKISGDEALAYGTNWIIKYYDGASRVINLGATTNWKEMLATDILEANKGYIIRMSTTTTGDYVLSFPIDKNLLQTAETAERTIAVTPYGEGTVAANHIGWNLVGMPYMSKFSGGGVGANYLTFHNGTSYTQSAKADVSSIQPFQSYFIQASTVGTTSNLSFANSSRQLVRSATADDVQKIVINISNAGGVDKTNLILDDNQSIDYVINQDLEKWLTTDTDCPQIYSTLNDIKYAFNALPVSSVNKLPLGVYTKNAGSTTIQANVSGLQGISALVLTDKVENVTTDLLSNNYTYNSTEGTDEARFEIAIQRVSTQNPISSEVGEPVYSLTNGVLNISNLNENSSVLHIFDSTGKLILNRRIVGNQCEVRFPSASISLIKIITGEKYYIKKLINN